MIDNVKSPEERQENTLMYCTLAAFGLSGIISQPLGSFIPFLKDAYGFSYDFSGVLLSCQSIGNLIAVLIAGIIPLYLGRRRSILLLSMWMGVAFFIFTAGIGNPIVLAAACLMIGISRGGNSNFSNTMMSTLPAEKSTRGFNLLHGCFALGALSSPILLVLLVKAIPGYGWRVMAGLLFVLCLVQLSIYRFMPVPEGVTKNVKSVDRSFLKHKDFWLAAMMLFFYISAEYAIVGWMVTYFQDIGVLSAQHAQLTSSLFWLLVFFGRLLGAHISGRVPAPKMLLIDGIGQFAFFLIMLLSTNTVLVLIGLAGVAFSFATIFPTAFSFGSGRMKGNDMGCSWLFLSGCIGGILAPAAVGFISEASGIKAGMALVGVMSGLLLAAILATYISTRKDV